MRVVVVSRWYPSEADPLAGVFVEDQVRGLRQVCDVHVLVPEPARLGRVLSRRGGPRAPVERVAVPASTAGSPLRALAFARSFAALGAAREDDVVVHVHELLPDALPALAAARLRGWPLVVTEHASFFPELLRVRRAYAQARLVLRHADAVLPVGDVLAARLRELEPGARLRRIANPVDLARFAPADRPARDFAVSVAISLGAAKGTDVLLRAWARAAERATVPPLVIVGDGGGRADAERLAAELGLGDRCRFVGLRSRDEVAELLRQAAFLVSASRLETFAGVVSEAIACGTPVVSTRSGDPGSYVSEEVGLLVEPGDVDGLAAAVAEMSERHDEYDPRRLHEHVAALFGADAVRDRLVELYREVIGRRRAGRS